MQLAFPKDIEASIFAKAAAAGFGSVEEYILYRLEADDGKECISEIADEQWLRKFDRFIANQISRNPHFDECRDSIYPDR